MADTKEYIDSPFYTAQANALTDYSQAPNLKDYGGNLHVLHAKVPLAKAGNTDILRLAILPPNAKVISTQSKVIISHAPGLTLTLDVGTEAVPDQYAKTLVATNAGSVAFDSVHNVTGQAVTPVKSAVATLICARVNTAVDASVATGSAATATFFIAYTLG